MATTRLYLVRHGATALTAEDRFSGAIGVELSDEGRAQAARLGERLHDEGITALYASPLSRTMETARIVGGHCGLEIEAREGLREISHGRWEGLTRARGRGAVCGRVRGVGRRSVHVRPGGRGVRRGGARSRAAA